MNGQSLGSLHGGKLGRETSSARPDISDILKAQKGEDVRYQLEERALGFRSRVHGYSCMPVTGVMRCAPNLLSYERLLSDVTCSPEYIVLRD